MARADGETGPTRAEAGPAEQRSVTRREAIKDTAINAAVVALFGSAMTFEAVVAKALGRAGDMRAVDGVARRVGAHLHGDGGHLDSSPYAPWPCTSQGGQCIDHTCGPSYTCLTHTFYCSSYFECLGFSCTQANWNCSSQLVGCENLGFTCYEHTQYTVC